MLKVAVYLLDVVLQFLGASFNDCGSQVCGIDPPELPEKNSRSTWPTWQETNPSQRECEYLKNRICPVNKCIDTCVYIYIYILYTYIIHVHISLMCI